MAIEKQPWSATAAVINFQAEQVGRAEITSFSYLAHYQVPIPWMASKQATNRPTNLDHSWENENFGHWQSYHKL
jgi:hypothetical protein